MTAAKIKKLRQKLNLTQDEFAKKVGVSRRTAQGWEAESDPHIPSPMAMAALEKLAVETQEVPA